LKGLFEVACENLAASILMRIGVATCGGHTALLKK
jgi:hypothetical protein